MNDFDWLIHKYKTVYDRVSHAPGCDARQIRHMMILEVKAYNAEPTKWQRESFSIMNQILGREKAADVLQGKRNKVAHTYSVVDWRRQVVQVKWWGIHLLQMSGRRPDDGMYVMWDRQRITVYTLEQLLRFELHPWKLTKLSDRRHHKKRDDKWTS